MKLKMAKLNDNLGAFRCTVGLPDNFHTENNITMEESLILITSDYKSFGGELKGSLIAI